MNHLIGGISSGGRALPEIDGYAFKVERSQGACLWGNDGQQYVDTAMGFGATMLGHAAPKVLAPVIQALQRGPMPSFAHDLEAQAAHALTQNTGKLSQVIFLNTGSEAVHLACRTARVATGRQRIARFAASYDGWFDQVAFGNAGSSEAQMPPSATRPEREGMLLLRYNDFSDAEQLFRDCPDLAAVIIEPVLANAGCIEPASGYLKHLSDLAHQHGALVILDEVLMGFRLHAGLAGHLLGVDADLATVGKAIGSGIPVAALLGTPEVMQLFEQKRIVRAGTYSGNPPACAAVVATLEQLGQRDYLPLIKRGNQLRSDIIHAFADEGLALSSSGYGSVFTFWPSDKAPETYAEAASIANAQWSLDLHVALRAEKVMTMPFAFGRVYLTFAHDEAAMQALLNGYKAAARGMAVKAA
ncbi:MAG TPA: aminotransferase class III-fold pyridoxal phosphate-dependent enzyme [Pseudomonas sp.]|jgi:glutamate-1-semialdehyde 2,1-aminomutase|uniref:aspartate aminotransferase family protein n=1 Tax=Pseudomonas sp. TaxID=306 RepID=UPI002ED98F55